MARGNIYRDESENSEIVGNREREREWERNRKIESTRERGVMRERLIF